VPHGTSLRPLARTIPIGIVHYTQARTSVSTATFRKGETGNGPSPPAGPPLGNTRLGASAPIRDRSRFHPLAWTRDPRLAAWAVGHPQRARFPEPPAAAQELSSRDTVQVASSESDTGVGHAPANCEVRDIQRVPFPGARWATWSTDCAILVMRLTG